VYNNLTWNWEHADAIAQLWHGQAMASPATGCCATLPWYRFFFFLLFLFRFTTVDQYHHFAFNI
jgi:hypothetical protein